MNPAAIIQLADFGIRLAVTLLEKRAGRPLVGMSDEQIRETIAALQIESPEDLLEQGRQRARSTEG